MKKLICILTIGLIALLGLSGCEANQTTSTSQKQQEQVKLKTAEEISTALKAKGLPIGNVIVYTAETDTNKLLGRPNQYISKVNFADTTLKQSDSNDPTGGSVEFFKTAADANARRDYINSIGKQSPMFTEYNYIKGTVLLRLNKDLTPDQASKYEKAFNDLTI